MNCGTLLPLCGGPFPFHTPVREVSPLEVSSPAIRGGLQPEASSSVRLQIYRVGKL